MVSCGDEADLYLKVWNIASSTTEPVSQLQTNQIRHKYMVQGAELDYFSVAAKTSEIRIHSFTFVQGAYKSVLTIF